MAAPGNYHVRNYNSVILARFRLQRKGGGQEIRGSLPRARRCGTLARGMPAHLRPPERDVRPVAALLLAVALAGLVLIAFAKEPRRATTGRAIPSTAVTAPASVLGNVIVSSTVPTAPPASAASGVTTSTTEGTSAPRVRRRSARTTDPTLIPPWSIVRDPTTTEPTTTTSETTTTTEATTTTSETTTTTSETTTTTN